MDDQARQAVRRFLLRARHHPETGGDQAIADRINALARKHVVGRDGVNAWINLRNEPNAWVLFALAVDLDISLDDFIFGDRGLAQRLAVLEAMVFDLIRWKQATEEQMTSQSQQAIQGPEHG